MVRCETGMVLAVELLYLIISNGLSYQPFGLPRELLPERQGKRERFLFKAGNCNLATLPLLFFSLLIRLDSVTLSDVCCKLNKLLQSDLGRNLRLPHE